MRRPDVLPEPGFDFAADVAGTTREADGRRFALAAVGLLIAIAAATWMIWSAFVALDRPSLPQMRPTLSRYVPPAGPSEREFVVVAVREVGP